MLECKNIYAEQGKIFITFMKEKIDFEKVKDKCSFITPVPGGVGPMTITMLLKNTLTASKEHKK